MHDYKENMNYIKDIVLTEEQKERYTKELESDNWQKYYEERTTWFDTGKTYY